MTTSSQMNDTVFCLSCSVQLDVQAVMGSLVKQYLGRRLGRPPEAIYHVAIMPCYDKKLEASREDFVTAGQLFETSTPFGSLHKSQAQTVPPAACRPSLPGPCSRPLALCNAVRHGVQQFPQPSDKVLH